MGTISCHSNQSSHPTGIKNITFVPPTYTCYMWNMERIRLTASEDGRQMPVYTISSPVSLRLR